MPSQLSSLSQSRHATETRSGTPNGPPPHERPKPLHERIDDLIVATHRTKDLSLEDSQAGLILQSLSYGSYYYCTLLILVQLDVLYRLPTGVTEVRFYSPEGFLHLIILYSRVALQAVIVNEESINQSINQS